MRSAALADCTKLSSVKFSESSQLKVIEMAVFYNDTALNTLILPESIIGLGGNAFGNITSLTLLDETGTWWYVPDGETAETWIAWCDDPESAEPASSANGTIDDIEEIKERADSMSLAEKILYAVQVKGYHLFCVK